PTTASATGTGTDTGSNGTAETDDPPSTSTATDDGVDSSSGDTPPLGPSCGHECGSAADCTVDGNDVGQDCLGGRCGVACADDNTCVAAASGWLAIPCMGDGECNGGTCVDIGGGMGGCALTPAIGACAKVALQEIQWPSIGGAMVTVCGQPNARCGDFDGTAACFIGCTAESCGEMPCGADGYCECAFDTQCVDVGLGNNCNAASRCELACQDAAECPAVGYDGGMVVCN
nr:hypothetical protein [Deltaproteobacteria bacterium]